MNLPRSSFYYVGHLRRLARPTRKSSLLVEDIQDEFPRYGYRRVTHELRRRSCS